MRGSRRVLRISGRFIITLLLLAAVVLTVSYFVFIYKGPAYVQWGILEKNIHSAVILRDEKVFTSPEYGKLVVLKPEGSRVAVNTPIAEIYNKAYLQTTLTDLVNKQRQISVYQNENLVKNLENKELDDFDFKIQVLSKSVEDQIKIKDGSGYISLYYELVDTINQRQAYIRQKFTPNQYLSQLYDDEKSITDHIAKWKTAVKATQEGYISYITDGCENLLTIQNLPTIQSKDITNIVNNSTIKTITDAKAQRPLYRLVNDKKWYVLMESAGASSFAEGSTQKLCFIGNSGEYDAKVYQVRPSGKGALIIFELESDITPFLNQRTVRVCFGKPAEGYRVPASSVKVNNGVTGVFVLGQKNARSFIPVTVYGTENGFSIVTNAEQGKPLKINQRVIR